MATTYPSHREADVVLRDGSTLSVRPVRSADEQGLRRFFEGLSEESRMFRFFSAAASTSDAVLEGAGRRLPRHATAWSRPGVRRLSVVAHALYVRTATRRAEVAFAIADEMQGRGLGTILLAHLAEAAEDNGIATFEAEVLPQNHRMIEVFRESGFPVEIVVGPGSIHVELPTSLSADAVERFEQRDRIAAAAAVRRFLRAALGRRRRRLAAPRHGRRRDLPQPARRRLQRRRLPGEPGRRGRPVGARLPAASPTSPGRSTWP